MELLKTTVNNNITFSNDQSSSYLALLQCFTLALFYVGSLYVYKNNLPRDHVITIKKRMLSVTFVCILSPIFVFCLGDVTQDGSGYSIFQWLGIHTVSITGVLVPLLLTMILFAGPLTLLILEMGIRDWLYSFTDTINLKDIKWYRTYVAAPFTEEFIFRSCMLPLLVPKFDLTWSIFLAPLFFGVAHLHHCIENLKKGYSVSNVVLSGVFQMGYTTIFGAYSAFLFCRTGTLAGPVVCHSFCNYMGFPDFGLVPNSCYPKFISCMFVLGLLSFLLLLFPLTEPSIYGGIYWT